MRFTITTCLAAIALFSGCAFEGTIVDKRFQPLPFPDTLGIDGTYKFELRDSAGQVHEQMVTPQVFANYEVGDYFNDLQAPPARGSKEGPVWVPSGVPPAPMRQIDQPYQPLRTIAPPYQPVRTSAAPLSPVRPPSRHEVTRIATVTHPTTSRSQRAKKKHRATKLARAHHRVKHKVASSHKKHSSKVARTLHSKRKRVPA